MGFFRSKEEKERDGLIRSYFERFQYSEKNREKLYWLIRLLAYDCVDIDAIVKYAINVIDDVIEERKSIRDTSKYYDLSFSFSASQIIPIHDDYKGWEGDEGEYKYEGPDSVINELLKRGYKTHADKIMSHLAERIFNAKDIHPNHKFRCLLMLERLSYKFAESDREDIIFSALEDEFQLGNQYSSCGFRLEINHIFPKSAQIVHKNQDDNVNKLYISKLEEKYYTCDVDLDIDDEKKLFEYAKRNKKRFSELIIKLINEHKLEAQYLYHYLQNDEEWLREVTNKSDFPQYAKYEIERLLHWFPDPGEAGDEYSKMGEFNKAIDSYEKDKCFQKALALLKKLGPEGFATIDDKGNEQRWNNIEERNTKYRMKFEKLEALVKAMSMDNSILAISLEDKYAYGEISGEEYERAKAKRDLKPNIDEIQKEEVIPNSVKEKMICSSCKEELSKDLKLKFCPYCGEKIVH